MKKIIFFIMSVFLFSCGSTTNINYELISKHPEWSKENVEMIRNGKISLGMTKEMVQAAWGKPKYISEMDNEFSGKITTWSYYALYSTKINTVSFNDKGVVSMFTDSSPNK